MIEELHEEMARPHMYEEILRDFGASHPAVLAYPGIFDVEKKRRYWVDENNNNCFMVYARALTITLGDDSRHWRWYPMTAYGHGTVVVAELFDVCSLEVQGTFKIGYLTPGTLYEVSYLMMMKEPKYGWEDKVDFSLTLPQWSNPEICKFDMRRLSKGRRIYHRIGEFTPSQGQSGDINFMLHQTVGKWKKGLVIIGVYIRPKT